MNNVWRVVHHLHPHRYICIFLLLFSLKRVIILKILLFWEEGLFYKKNLDLQFTSDEVNHLPRKKNCWRLCFFHFFLIGSRALMYGNYQLNLPNKSFTGGEKCIFFSNFCCCTDFCINKQWHLWLVCIKIYTHSIFFSFYYETKENYLF